MTIAGNRKLSNCEKARKKGFRGFPLKPRNPFFRGFSQLLKLRFTGMVTYSIDLYSRSSHHFILCFPTLLQLLSSYCFFFVLFGCVLKMFFFCRSIATLTPEHGTSSYSKVSTAIGISVAVTFVICFLIAAIVVFLMLKTWRRKQLEQRSVHSSSTQLSELSREGTPLKRNRSVTTTTELMGNGSAIDLRDLKRSPPLPAIKIKDSNSNSRPSSSSSSDWLPMKRSGRLPALNWTPPRSIAPVLLPSEVRRKQSVPPSIPPIDLGESAHSTLNLSPRKAPEGSDLSKPERSASVNSWFPAEEVQYNV